MNKRSVLFLIGVAAFTLIISSVLLANNPIAVNEGGNATRWANFPIQYTTDGGLLGALSLAQANTLTAQAFGAWTGVATANVSAAPSGGSLTADGDVNTLAEFNAMGCVDVNPIVYDTDGSLTDALLGAGASNNVLGFAGSCAISAHPDGNLPGNPDTILGGLATMNGKLITSNVGLAISRSRGVFIHELGHFLGLGHSQVNLNCLTNQASCPSNTPGGDLFGVPTMFPILLNQTEDAGNISYSETLTVDDNSAISTLYPNPNNSFTTNFGTISGSVFFSDLQNEAQGINVIARRVGDPRVTAISNVSGAFARANDGNDSLGLPGNGPGSNSSSARGDFTIPGLPPGTYTLEIESINPSFIGGSSVGPLSRPTGRNENIPIPSPAVAECFGGPESNADNPVTCQSIVVAAGNDLNGNNFILNETFAPLDASDAVASNDIITSATNIGAGTFTRSISDEFGGDDQDVYALNVTSGTPISIEIRSRRLSPVRYLDSVIELTDASGVRLLDCRIGDSGGPFDQPCVDDDYTPTGGSLTRDSKLQFNPTSTGVIFLIVSDRFGDARPDFIYELVIGGVAPVPTVTFSPLTLDFGSRPVGIASFPPETVRVTNNSVAAVNLTGFTIVGGNAADFALGAPFFGESPVCDTAAAGVTPLAAGTSCFFGVTFTAGAAGLRSATIRATHTAGDSPADLTVSGTGSAGPPNDNLADAIETVPNPFFDSQDTQLATEELTDLSLNPGGGSTCIVDPAINRSIWYRFRLPSDSAATARIQLFAGYAAALAVAVDNDLGAGIALAPFGCFAVPAFTQATLNIGLPAGGEGFDIYFMVAATAGDGGFTQFAFTYTLDGVNVDLSIAVTDNNLVFTEGANANYVVTVSNAAGGTATTPEIPIQVQDFLPTGLSFVSGVGNGWTCNAVGGLVTCSLDAGMPIAAGGNSQFTLTVLPNPPAAAGSPVTNRVQVFGGGDTTSPIPVPPLFLPSNNSASDATFVNPAPAPVVDIAPPSFAFGGVSTGAVSPTQTFTLLNSGNGNLSVTGISLTGADAGSFSVFLGGGFTCPAAFPFNVTPSASCTFGANFAPLSGGAKNANVSVASNASTSPNLVALSGNGVPQGTLVANPTLVDFGSQTVGVPTALQTVVLSNTGPGDLTVSALDIAGNAANSDDFQLADPPLGTDCPVDTEPFVPFVLTSGGSCNIRVAFNPQALGIRQLTVTFTATNSTIPSVVVNLTGTGIGGNITFTNAGGDNLWTNPANWDLARTPIAADTVIIGAAFNVTLNSGAHTIAALSMTSTGTLAITGAGVSLTVTSPSTATNINIIGNGHLAADGTLAISGILNLNNGGLLDASGNVSVATQLNWAGGAGGPGNITGTGQITNNGVASINGGAIATKTFINAGTANVTNLTMSDGAIFNNLLTRTINAGTNSVGFAQGSGATSVLNNQGLLLRNAAGGNYDINGVQFNNSGTVTVIAGVLRVINGLAGQYTQTAPGLTQLTNGASGDIQVSTPLLLQGGTLGGVRTVTGGVNNSGGVARPGNSPGILTFTSTYTQGANPAALNIEIGGTTVGTQYDQLNVTGAPGTATLGGTLNVTLISGFVPVSGNSFTILTSTGAVIGTFAGGENLPALPAGLSWRVTYNSNSVVLDVVAPAVTFAPTNVDFGSVLVGQQSAITNVQLTNSGTATLNITSIGLAGADPTQFAIVAPTAGTNCVGLLSLAASASCNIGTRFGPTTPGAKNAQVSVVDDAPGSPHIVPLTGTGFVQGTLSVDRASVDFGNTVVGTPSAAQTIVVTNTGAGSITLTDVAFVSGHDEFEGAAPVAGDCIIGTTVLAPTQNCNLRGVFTPTAAGLRTGNYNLTASNAGNSPLALTFSGTGIGGNITFTNGGGDSLWTNPANWDLNRIPIPGDTAIIGAAFNVTLNLGSQTIGSLNMTSTGTLTIIGGGVSLTLTAPSTATNLSVSGGSLLTANGTLSISGTLTLSLNGAVNGTANITILGGGGQLAWSSGTISGTGLFINSGTANITGGALNNKTFNNAGGGQATVSSLTMSNGAIFSNQAGSTISAQTAGNGFVQGTGLVSTINNSSGATLNRFPGPGTYVISGVQFNNAGTVLTNGGDLQFTAGPVGQYTQTGGSTSVNAGNIQVDTPLQMTGGTLRGNRTLFGGLVNSNSTTQVGNAAAGILTITTSYTQTGGGSALNIELGGTTVGTQYDQLDVTGAPGTAALGGSLNVTLINGFVPALGNSFTIVQSTGARTGTFATTSLPALGAGLSWRVTYNANSIVLDVVAPNVTLAPDPLNFGNVKVATASSAMAVTVTNSGSAAATLAAANAVTITGTHAADFAIAGGTTCANNTVLQPAPGPGNTCVINLTFTPGALGVRAATISVASNDADSPDTAALAGTGALANVTVTPNPVAFGNIPLTTSSAPQTITVTNSGTLAAALSGPGNPVTIAGANPGDFAIAGGTTCVAGFVLNAVNGSCIINIVFTPGALGARGATLSVSNDAPGSPHSTALTGTGVQAAINLSPSPVIFGNQRVNTASAVVPVTVTNLGTLAATLAGANAVTITGANLGDFAIVAGTTCADGTVLQPAPGPGHTCIVNLTFTPPATGARAAVLNIASSATGSPHTANLNGTGVLANVTLAPDPLNFGNQRQNVTSAAQTITVTNAGNENATLSAGAPVTIVGANAGDFAILPGTTTCVANFVLNANGGSCLIRITFTPGALGPRTATVNVADDAPNSPQTATLNGTGVIANVALAPNPLDFGDQKVITTSAPQTITVTNSGTEAATLAAANVVTFTGTNASDFALAAGTTCVANFVIAPGGGSCVISITFRPGGLGARTATVNVADDAPGSPQQATLNGTGVQAQLVATPNPVNFGNVALTTTSAPQTITVTNTGTLAATLQAGNPLTITGTNPGDFIIAAGTTCVGGLVLNAGGGSCIINVTFSPAVLGARTATLTTFAPGDNPAFTTLNGTGVQAAVNLSPSPVNFGNQRINVESAAMIVTATNNGSQDATLIAGTPVTIVGANSGDFDILAGPTTCIAGFVLTQGGGSCVIHVTFTPLALGARAGTVRVETGAVGSPHTTNLTGTGTAPIAVVAPTPHDFGTRIINTTSPPQTFTVSNTGTDVLNVASIVLGGADAAHFAFVNGGAGSCALALGIVVPGGNCTFTVAFAPTTSGAKVATVTVSDDSNAIPGSTQIVDLSGTGQTPPTADVAPTNIPFGNQRMGTLSAPTVVTVTNNGGATLAIADIVLGGANANQFSIAGSGATPCNLAGGNVPGGASCTFSVTFSPTATGPQAATVTITHNGNPTGTPGSQTVVTLSGTGIQANVTLAPNPTSFGNQRVGTTSAAMTITVTNSGTDIATLAAGTPVTFAGVNATDFAIVPGATTCVANFILTAGGGSCIIDITFTPGTLGARAATVNVADDAPGTPQTAALNGTGIQANVTLAPNPTNFGDVKVGLTSAAMTVTVTNAGTDVTTLAAANPVTLTGAHLVDFAITGGTCAASLVLQPAPGPGNTCTITITFAPSVIGARTATVNVADDAPGSPQTATLNGNGAQANVTLAPNPLSFGGINLGSNSTLAVTVTNSGTFPATLTAGAPVTITGANPADFAIAGGTTCVANFVLNANGGSCIVNITFTPQALLARTATVNVADDAPGSPQTAALNGNGTQPGFNLSSAATNFGSVQVGTTQAGAAITVTNTGTGPLTINSNGIALGGANPGDFLSATTCPVAPATLAAAATCTITPSMSPQSGSTSPRAANITITHNAAGSPHSIALTGTGVDFLISFGGTPPPPVIAGGTVNFNLSFGTLGGNSLFPTTFACSGLPRKSECIFTPPSIPAGSGDTTVALAISTTSNTAISAAGVVGGPLPGSTPPAIPLGPPLAAAAGALGLLLLVARRRLVVLQFASTGRLCLLALMLTAGGYLAGCSGEGYGFPEGASGTPPGSYTVTVTAMSGTVQRSTTVNLTVQ